MPIGNGKQTYSYNTLKSMKKEELINVIRCLESNLINANNTIDIQAENCKKLLIEERNKTVDDFISRIAKDSSYVEPVDVIEVDRCIFIAEQLRGERYE